MPAACALPAAAAAAGSPACAATVVPASAAHCAVLASIERSVSCRLGDGVTGCAWRLVPGVERGAGRRRRAPPHGRIGGLRSGRGPCRRARGRCRRRAGARRRRCVRRCGRWRDGGRHERRHHRTDRCGDRRRAARGRITLLQRLHRLRGLHGRRRDVGRRRRHRDRRRHERRRACRAGRLRGLSRPGGPAGPGARGRAARRVEPSRRCRRLDHLAWRRARRAPAARFLAPWFAPGFALRVRAPQRRPREASVALRRHRIDGVGGRRLHHVGGAAHAAVLVAVQRAARQVGDAARLVVVAAPGTPEAHAERRVEPVVGAAPVEPEQPGQPGDEQRHHHERRADMAEHALEAGGEQMAEGVAGVAARQRGGERAARHEHAGEAEPEADRAASGAAARQHRLHEPPDQGDEPDGRHAEPAENYRMHTRKRRVTRTGATRGPSGLSGRSIRRPRAGATCRRGARPIVRARIGWRDYGASRRANVSVAPLSVTR